MITAIGGEDSFIDMVYETIDPMVRALQRKVITVDMLHGIRRRQTLDPNIWHAPHGGDLDIVTDVHDPDYWRPYAGQSNGPKLRIQQHA